MALYDRHSDALCAQEIRSFLVVIPLLNKAANFDPSHVEVSNRPTNRQRPVRILYAQPARIVSGEAVYKPRHFWRLGPVPWSLDAQWGSTLRQVGKLPRPVSGRLFSISIFDTRRPVRELAETGSWTAGRRSACPAARGWPSCRTPSPLEQSPLMPRWPRRREIGRRLAPPYHDVSYPCGVDLVNFVCTISF